MAGSQVFYCLPVLAAGLCALTLALFAWRRRHATGVAAFALVMAAVAWWSFGYTFELAGQDLPTKLLAAQAKYPGILATPILWLGCASQLTGGGHWLTRRRAVLAALPAIATLGLIWTNDAHHLYWQRVALEPGSVTLTLTGGPAFWFYVAYAYGCLALGTGRLIWLFAMPHGLYRHQARVILSGSMLPWVSNVLFVTGLTPLAHLDLTPFAFALTGLILWWGLLRVRLLDIVMVARDQVFESMGDPVLVVDRDGRIVDLNRAAHDLLRGRPANPLGQPLTTCLPELGPVSGLIEGAPGEIAVDRDGRTHHYDLRVSPLMVHHQPAGRLVVLRDVTERRRWEQHLLHQTLHDSLTGLPNRTLFFDRLDRSIRTARRDGTLVACLVVDLDGFKRVNDELGHGAGDTLLQVVAAACSRVLRDSDTLARLGGDEFAVLLPGSSHAGAMAVGQKLLAALRQPFAVGHAQARLDASVGVALFPDHALDGTSLLAGADSAMYRAKRTRTGCAIAAAPHPSTAPNPAARHASYAAAD